MWKALRQALLRLRHRSRRRAEARRVAEERTRFWAELRKGEHEAEARSGS